VQLRQRLHLPLLAALLAPAACAPRDDKADPRADAEDSAAADAAGDGAAPAPDCAAAPLDCDGINNDCDGQTDEGAEVEGRIPSGQDRDGDGWSTEAPTLACPPVGIPAAPLAGGGDCDDRDAARSPGKAEDCLRAGDEDCDERSDCADPHCAGLPCFEDCADGVDNDLDGLTDCADTEDCTAASACAEDCADGVDNDLDGLTDCADTESCAAASACAEDCADGGDNHGDGTVDCADPRCASAACPELCGDGVDNDADRATDCDDEDCHSDACVELCRDGDDNDGDGLFDCRDPDCWGSGCWEDCALDGDEDGDGLADCEDSSCITDCTERCDAVDRDRDGLAGCDDPDCGLMIECWTGLRGGAEGLRLELSMWDRGGSFGQDAALQADALWLSGVAHTASGAPIDCADSLHGLTAMAHVDRYRRSSHTGNRSSSTVAFSGDPVLHPDCPFVGPGDVVVDALHWASIPSDWALLPGDVHQMLQLQQAAPTGTRLGWISLYVTAQTGSTVGTSPSVGVSAAHQVVFGTPTFEPAP